MLILQVFAIRLWHVLGDCGEAPAQHRAQVGSNAFAAIETLDGRRRHAHVDLLLHQTMRDAVIVAGTVDVIVDVHDRGLPLGEFVAGGRERLHG